MPLYAYTMDGSRMWGSIQVRHDPSPPTLACITRPMDTLFREEGKSRKQRTAPRLPTT